MRVLQIEDDGATAQSVELMLKVEGFKVYTTDLGEEGIDLAKVYDYDAILLDLNLPDMSGLDVLRALRAGGVNTPVIVVTGSSEIVREVACFAAGADDFIRKPFHRDVLVARLHAVIRRSKGHAADLIEVGPLCLDIGAKTVSVDGQRVHLTPREYAMVELMALRKGSTLTKEMFLNHLYGGMDEPELKIIDVFICKIRGKLKPFGAKALLETSWGRGYRLVDAPTPPEAETVEPRPERAPGGCKGVILRVLAAGPARFSALQAAIPGALEGTVRNAIGDLVAAALVDRSTDAIGRRVYRLAEAAAAA